MNIRNLFSKYVYVYNISGTELRIPFEFLGNKFLLNSLDSQKFDVNEVILLKKSEIKTLYFKQALKNNQIKIVNNANPKFESSYVKQNNKAYDSKFIRFECNCVNCDDKCNDDTVRCKYYSSDFEKFKTIQSVSVENSSQEYKNLYSKINSFEWTTYELPKNKEENEQ